MIVNCPTCGTYGYEADPQRRELLELPWDEIRWADIGDTFCTGTTTAKVIQDIPAMDYDSYGAGIEGEVSVVIELADGRLMKREAYRDSYGTVDWSIDIREVKPQPRVVTVYDYL